MVDKYSININLTQKEKDVIYINEYGLYCLIFGKKMMKLMNSKNLLHMIFCHQ